jgi:hypothetical protein
MAPFEDDSDAEGVTATPTAEQDTGARALMPMDTDAIHGSQGRHLGISGTFAY